jgi:T-complex protein 10 C-terminus
MDGKRERMFRDGRRMVVFVNGTIKEEYPLGLSIVRFTNGDIKKAYKNGAEPRLVGALLCAQPVSRRVITLCRCYQPDCCWIAAAGLVEYLYAEVDTWHTTCTDGTQVFHFASGQAEAHRPDGSKEVCLGSDSAVSSIVLPVLDVLSSRRICQRI